MRINLPNIDRRAALLAGFEVGTNPHVDVDINTELGDARVAVIEALTLHGDNSATFRLPVTAPTATAIVAAITTAADERRQLLADLAQAAFEIINIDERSAPAANQTLWHTDERGLTASIGRYDGFCVPQYRRFSSDLTHWASVFKTPEWQAYSVAVDDLKKRGEAANTAAKEAARPDALIAFAETQRKNREAAEREEAAKQARLAATAVKRIETSYWERETASYNSRREGKPWCARVTAIDSRGKLVYEWAEWTGRIGEAGLLRCPCKPGDIIAWGQRDLRRGDRSDHKILRMQENGTMIEITAAQAAKILRGEG